MFQGGRMISVLEGAQRPFILSVDYGLRWYSTIKAIFTCHNPAVFHGQPPDRLHIRSWCSSCDGSLRNDRLPHRSLVQLDWMIGILFGAFTSFRASTRQARGAIECSSDCSAPLHYCRRGRSRHCLRHSPSPPLNPCQTMVRP